MGEVGNVPDVVVLVRVLGVLVALDDLDVRNGGRGLEDGAEDGVVAWRVAAGVGGAVAEEVGLGAPGVGLGFAFGRVDGRGDVETEPALQRDGGEGAALPGEGECGVGRDVEPRA